MKISDSENEIINTATEIIKVTKYVYFELHT